MRASNKLLNLVLEAVGQRSFAKKLLKKVHTPTSIFNKGARQQVYYTEAVAEAFWEIFQDFFFMEPLVASILFKILFSNLFLDVCFCFLDQGFAKKELMKQYSIPAL